MEALSFLESLQHYRDQKTSATENMDTQQKVLKRMREMERDRRPDKLTEDDVSGCIRALYDKRVIKDPLNFYCQSPDGRPLVKVSSRVGGKVIYCIVAFKNELRADAWKNQKQLENFGTSTWPPIVVSDLLGCSTVGDVCIQCRLKGDQIQTGKEYRQWSIQMYDFWLDNIQLSTVARVKGYGLIARNDIARKTIIGEYTGDLIPIDESIPDKDTEYNCEIDIGLRRAKGEPQAQAWLDATNKGSIFRFMNHSSDAKTKFVQGRCGIHNRIMYVYTTRDIKKGDEITVNYGREWWSKSDHPCLCGSKTCYKPPPKDLPAEKTKKQAEKAKDNREQQYRTVKSNVSNKDRNRQQAKEPAHPVRRSPRRHGGSTPPSGRDSPSKAAASPLKVRKRLIRRGPIKLESVHDDDYSVRRPATLNNGNDEDNPSGKKVAKKTGRAKHRS
jgi:hypothetical protein